MKRIKICGYMLNPSDVCASLTGHGYTIKKPPVTVEQLVAGVTFTCVKRGEDDYSVQVGDSGHPFSYGANDLIKIQDLLDELMEAEVD